MKTKESKNLNAQYVRGTAIAEMIDISVRTLYRMVARGEFPRPVRIGKGTTRWRLADVEAYLARLGKQDRTRL